MLNHHLFKHKANSLFITSVVLILVFLVTAFRPSKVEREKFKKSKIKDLAYSTIMPENNYYNLNMLGYVNKYGVQGSTKNERLYGMVLRALRFQNITKEVEQLYGLSENLVLAMVIQETGGADILPNGSDDGGLGLCHMQPSIAVDFELKTYNNCNVLVSKTHGRSLNKLIIDNKSDRRKLIKYDDRFHPIKNLDAVGRILSYYKNETRFNLPTEEKRSIRGYAGSINYKKYYKNIKYFQRLLNDPDFIAKVRQSFNSRNPKFKINKTKANFDLYIKSHQDQNINYGLLQYKILNLRKKTKIIVDTSDFIITNNSAGVLKDYSLLLHDYRTITNKAKITFGTKENAFVLLENEWEEYINLQCLFNASSVSLDSLNSTVYYNCLAKEFSNRIGSIKKQLK